MIAQKRAKNVAIAGLIGQVLFTGVLVWLFLWTHRSQSALVALWLSLGAIPLWKMAAVLFYCRQLEQQEALEIEEIARSGQEGSIFAEKGQGRPAQARLAFVYRWIVPTFTVVMAIYHAVFGALLLRSAWLTPAAKLVNLMPAALFGAIVWFLAFLFSRYATGMGRSAEWRPLRAVGSYTLLVSGAFFLTSASLIASASGYPHLDRIVAMVLPVVQCLLAVELLMNFIFDLYRPRLPGQEQHLSFDSRMLGLMAEPQRVGHSIAETLNYQFGFEVSKTWFYQLLSRAMVPLLVFAAVVLIAITSIVIVPQGERAIVLRWGQVGDAVKADPVKNSLAPGLHLKWPWPVETVHRYHTGRVQELWLGAGKHRTKEEIEAGKANGVTVELWTSPHGPREELDFLVALPVETRVSAGKGEAGEVPPLAVIKLVVPVQYVVRDPLRYSTTYSDPRAMLECVAHREMVEYCARATLTESIQGPAEQARPEAIMTHGREKAAAALKAKIQQAADELKLGVEIVNVNLLAVHPHKDAAESFEKVGEAERTQDVERYRAQGQANEMLAKAAGDAQVALRLALALRRVNDLERLAESRTLGAEVDRLLSDVRDIAQFHRNQIERQRALGRLSEPWRRSVQELIEGYEKHAASLEEVKSRGAAFGFASALAEARGAADRLLAGAGGEIGVQIAKANAERWKTELAEQGRSLAFSRELAAHDASPQVYAMDRWLDVWDQVLPGVTKYVLAVPKDRVELRFNAEMKASELGGIKLEDK